MPCLYSFGQKCLLFTFLPHLNSETYYRKYEKLPNIVTHACKNITEKIICWKCVAPKFGFYLFSFGFIASKQLKSLTTIDSVSWLGGAKVTHLLCVWEVPGSIPIFGKGFYVWFVVVFLLFVQNHIICHNILQFLLKC